MLTTTPLKSDLEALLELNADYIRSVQTSDVTRFDQILADDFVCTNPDGSFIDRADFLKQTARPVMISNLAAHDVMVRGRRLRRHPCAHGLSPAGRTRRRGP